MRSTLRRLMSRKSDIGSEGEETSASAPKKQRPEFKPRPDSIIEYAHDTLESGLKEIVRGVQGDVDFPKLAKNFDEIADLLRVQAVHEAKGLLKLIKGNKSANEAASDLIKRLVSEHDGEQKDAEGIRADLRDLVANGKSKQGGEGEDGSKSEDADKGDDESSAAVADVKSKIEDFVAAQSKRLKRRRDLHKKLIPELFTPVGTATKNMTAILDADRSELDAFLQHVAQYIIGTERTGRVRQLVDAIQRTSGAQYAEHVKYLSEAISAKKERLWNKLCTLGYDKPLDEPEKEKGGKPAKAKFNKQAAGRRSVRARLHINDTVAIRDPVSNERLTGVVEQIVAGGERLKLKVMKSSEIHHDDLVLTLFVNKGDCKKVVTRETWDFLLKQQTPKEEPKEQTEEPKSDEDAGESEGPVARKDDQGATKEEAKEAESARKGKEEEEVQISAEVEEDPFPVITLTERALSLSIESLRKRLAELDAADAKAVAAWGQDFAAASQCIAAREEIQDDKFVARFIGKELKGEWKEERRYDASQRKALSKLVSSDFDEAALTKLRSGFAEWAEDHVAHLGREAKSLRSRKHREGLVRKHRGELVQRKPELFERDIAAFVIKQLESDQEALNEWREAVETTSE